MPNTQFTESFVDIVTDLTDITQTVLVGNFVVNLALAGTLTLLWGLLNILQIVSHFPLVNITMPSNAH